MTRLQLHPNVSLINSLRSIGYSLEISIADIIDNSLSANATIIHINFDFFDKNLLQVAIVDNGIGMDYTTLLHAITLGSKDPNRERDHSDLGRFGLGLKTASFAQCRSLTLVSKQENIYHGLTMDLDDNERFQDWGVNELSIDDIKQLYGYEQLLAYSSGTLVLWNKCDRLLEIENENINNIEVLKENIYGKFSVLDQYLGLVFHRWIEPNVGIKKVNIFLNNVAIKAVDPFARKLIATQEIDEQTIYYQDTPIYIKGFVLPHHNKCSEKEYKENSLGGDYVATQGFYIYRNRRLLIGGDWLKLYPKKELTKLTRILIDIPNTLDFEWKIDIKKSSVELPNSVKRQLKQFIERYCTPSKRTYTYKGRVADGFTPIWNRFVDKNLFQYSLNNEHPLILSFNESLDSQQKQRFKMILNLIADFLPKSQIFADMGSNPHGNIPQHSQQDILNILVDYFNILKSSLTKEQFVQVMRTVEPFDKLEEQTIQQFLNGN